jgi:uncharacterized membrane protein YeaQ/YmgE (transglycosylase-associated protein family)
VIAALLVGLVAGCIARVIFPGDVFRNLQGPKSWGVSLAIGLVGSMVG